MWAAVQPLFLTWLTSIPGTLNSLLEQDNTEPLLSVNSPNSYLTISSRWLLQAIMRGVRPLWSVMLTLIPVCCRRRSSSSVWLYQTAKCSPEYPFLSPVSQKSIVIWFYEIRVNWARLRLWRLLTADWGSSSLPLGSAPLASSMSLTSWRSLCPQAVRKSSLEQDILYWAQFYLKLFSAAD